jgi:hypothetical protein
MLEVVADAYHDSLELSGRRDRFTCADFTYSIALNEMSGIVVLLPEQRTLIVSASMGYERIRVIDSEGTPIGTLGLGADGRVIWSTPDLS